MQAGSGQGMAALEVADLASSEAGPEVELPPPQAPMEVARTLVRALFTHLSGELTLRHWRGGWWAWQGPCWVEVEQRAIEAAAYRATERAVYWSGHELKPWLPNRHKIA